jgi:hypothetical protein
MFVRVGFIVGQWLVVLMLQTEMSVAVAGGATIGALVAWSI